MSWSVVDGGTETCKFEAASAWLAFPPFSALGPENVSENSVDPGTLYDSEEQT